VQRAVEHQEQVLARAFAQQSGGRQRDALAEAQPPRLARDQGAREVVAAGLGPGRDGVGREALPARHAGVDAARKRLVAQVLAHLPGRHRHVHRRFRRQAEAAQAERDRLHSVAMNHILAARDGTADPDAAITSLRNTTEPDLAKRLITDIILQEQSAAEAIQDAAAEARADRVIFLLKAGQTLDPEGNLVEASPPALRDAATRYFFDRTLTRAQYEEVAAHIQGKSDDRVKAFTRRAFEEISPELQDAFREDELGHTSLDLSKLPDKKRPSKPGIKRQWFEPGAASGKPRTEEITFGHINEAVNTIRLALREDPAMTTDLAIERFRGLIRGTIAEHRDKKIEDAIAADAAFYLKMRETNAQTILRHLAPR